MAGKNSDRSSRIRSFFENDMFVAELNKIKKDAEASDIDENLDIEIIKLRKRWKLSWDYHETIAHYLETGDIDYSLGDPDIRIIDYRAKIVVPSDSPRDEFLIMDSLKDVRKNGVYIKLPKDINQTSLVNFIKENYELIDTALNNNFTDRHPNQSPDLLTKRKVNVFRLYEQDLSSTKIAEILDLDPREVRRIIKEIKERISS